MAISMLKIRRPLGRLIFNMGIAIPGKTVFLIETAPRCSSEQLGAGAMDQSHTLNGMGGKIEHNVNAIKRIKSMSMEKENTRILVKNKVTIVFEQKGHHGDWFMY